MAQRMGNLGTMWQISDIGVPSTWLHRISKHKETCKAWMSLYGFFFILSSVLISTLAVWISKRSGTNTCCNVTNGITFKTQIVVVYVQR